LNLTIIDFISDSVYYLLDIFLICGSGEDGCETFMAGTVHYCLYMHIGL